MPKKVSFATSNRDNDPYNSSGFNGFPFAVNSRDEEGNKFQEWDGTNHYTDGKPRTVYGPGTFYPVGLTFEEAIFLYWRVKRLSAFASYTGGFSSASTELTTGISGGSDLCNTSVNQVSSDGLVDDDEVKYLINRNLNNTYLNTSHMSGYSTTMNRSYVYFVPPSSASDENIQASASVSSLNTQGEVANNEEYCANDRIFNYQNTTYSDGGISVFKNGYVYGYYLDGNYSYVTLFPMIYSEDTELYYPSIDLSISTVIGDCTEVFCQWTESISTSKLGLGGINYINLWPPYNDPANPPPSDMYTYTSATCSLILPSRTITFPIYGVRSQFYEYNENYNIVPSQSANTVTPSDASIWIASYWPYDDGNGNPIYDINTGETLRDPVTGVPVG